MYINDPWILREHLRSIAEKSADCFYPSKGAVGSIIGEMEKVIKQNIQGIEKDEVRTIRTIVLGWLFGPDDDTSIEPLSSSELSAGQLEALKRWIGSAKIADENGKEKWLPRGQFPLEFTWCVARARCVVEFMARMTDDCPTIFDAHQVMKARATNELGKQIHDLGMEVEPGGMVDALLQLGASFGNVTMDYVPDGFDPGKTYKLPGSADVSSAAEKKFAEAFHKSVAASPVVAPAIMKEVNSNVIYSDEY